MQNSTFIIEPDQAEAMINSEPFLVLDLCKMETYRQYHLPGAIHLNYKHLINGQFPAPGGLPEISHLQALFSALGLKPDTKVLVYDDEGGAKACRLIWTLDVIGHPHYYLINGGLYSWINEGHSCQQEAQQPQPGEASLHYSELPVADKNYVHSVLNSDEHVLLDTRTLAEYEGQKGAGLRKGRIPGAVHFDWLEAIDKNNNLRLLPDAQLAEQLAMLGLSKDKEIITYCYTFHRSAHTYALLKHLGYPRVKGYAGSWAEWASDPELPIE